MKNKKRLVYLKIRPGRNSEMATRTNISIKQISTGVFKAVTFHGDLMNPAAISVKEPRK